MDCYSSMVKWKYTLLEAWQALKRVHCRAQPNDGFAKTLLDLVQKLHGKVLMECHQRKTVMKVCPICGKNAGLSSSSLKLHLLKSHRKLSSGIADSAMTKEIEKALKIGRGGRVSPTQTISSNNRSIETVNPYAANYQQVIVSPKGYDVQVLNQLINQKRAYPIGRICTLIIKKHTFDN